MGDIMGISNSNKRISVILICIAVTAGLSFGIFYFFEFSSKTTSEVFTASFFSLITRIRVSDVKQLIEMFLNEFLIFILPFLLSYLSGLSVFSYIVPLICLAYKSACFSYLSFNLFILDYSVFINRGFLLLLPYLCSVYLCSILYLSFIANECFSFSNTFFNIPKAKSDKRFELFWEYSRTFFFVSGLFSILLSIPILIIRIF